MERATAARRLRLCLEPHGRAHAAGTLVTAVGFMPNGFARSSAGEYTSNMFCIVGIA